MKRHPVTFPNLLLAIRQWIYGLNATLDKWTKEFSKHEHARQTKLFFPKPNSSHPVAWIWRQPNVWQHHVVWKVTNCWVWSNLIQNWPQKTKAWKWNIICLLILDNLAFIIKHRVYFRTSINEVNNKRHLGLTKKTSPLHSLKTPLIYECNKSNIVKYPWIFIANWKYAESGINEDEGILKLWLWRLMTEKQRQVSQGYNITLNFSSFCFTFTNLI